jgi:hypothetical protein
MPSLQTSKKSWCVQMTSRFASNLSYVVTCSRRAWQQRSSCSQTQSQRSYSRQSPTPEPNLNLSGTSLPPTLLAQNSPDALFLQSLSARQSNSPSESDRNSRMHEALVNASPGTSTWQRNLQNANPTWQPSPNRREFEYNSTVDTYYALRTGNSSSQFSEDSNR